MTIVMCVIRETDVWSFGKYAHSLSWQLRCEDQYHYHIEHKYEANCQEPVRLA